MPAAGGSSPRRDGDGAERRRVLVGFSGNNGATINGATINGATIASLSDGRGAGGGQAGGVNAGSRAEMAQTKSGTTTFQVGYRRAGSSATCTFTNMSIITQVY